MQEVHTPLINVGTWLIDGATPLINREPGGRPLGLPARFFDARNKSCRGHFAHLDA